VPKLLTLEAGHLLIDAVRCVPDLPESDVVKIIRHLLLELQPEVATSYFQNFEGRNGKKRKLSGANASGKKKKTKASKEDDGSKALSCVATALTRLLEAVLSRPHNPAFLRSSLAAQLGTSNRFEAQCLLTALNQIIKTSKKTGIPYSAKEIKGALDWVGAVLDSQFTGMVFDAKSDSSLRSLFRNIDGMIEDQLSLSESLIEVKSMLELLLAPNPVRLSSKEAPDYSLEVLRF